MMWGSAVRNDTQDGRRESHGKIYEATIGEIGEVMS